MNDPVSMLFNVVFRALAALACLVVDGIRHTAFNHVRSSNSPRITATPQPVLDANKRMADCRDVVVSYANHLGYIAREAMSREELEQKIDAGINPDVLANEIQDRIDVIPG